ncbi:unnamed protein product [Caenorhabditis auriculariae]|uniref:Uncharacterized protein n=1 Tax=Caenorhabditis auriculariae TaxID=2777116 RepID=A0A8S1HME2_9PELO|nr:unnamed protein product [Caenorhabditis auriculariae]
MYPFNRTSSLRVEESAAETPLAEQKCFEKDDDPEKTIFASILELSRTRDSWTRALSSGRRQTIFECSWRGVHCVSNSFRPLLLFFRLLAIFPTRLDGKAQRKTGVTSYLKYFFFLNFCVLAVLLNSYLVNINLWLIANYENKFGLMHAATVSCMITGTKPVINTFVIIFSVLKFRSHERLLKTVDMVDVCFRSAFHIVPPLKMYKIVFFFTICAVVGITFALKVVEFISTEQSLGNNLLMDSSFIIVPLLSLWNIIPLLYYHLYNHLIRFYCNTLINSLNMEHKKRHFSLKFYYEQFLRITNVQEAVGNLFNPFLLFSLAWSLLVLCLTIYFLTQPHSSLMVPIAAEQITNPRTRYLLTRSVHFFICWAAIQIVTAVLHIVVICSTGMKTNETTRQIVNAVLRIVPDANADLDRFQISCFVHKMTTQFMWGMTVWRAFPLERTTFFTLISVIVTYSLLLVKFKENEMVKPITISINGTSSSFQF